MYMAVLTLTNYYSVVEHFFSDLMESYKKKESAPYDMDDFLRLRSNPECYKVFFKYFIKCVTKKNKYEEKLPLAKSFEDICTVSDEAFALLLLENSWDKWMDQYNKDPSSLLPRRGRHLDKPVSKIKTKYTKGGLKYEDDQDTTLFSSKHNKGWSDEGIKRYNQLYELVEADRANHPEFFQKFMDYVIDSKKKKVKKPAPKKDPPVQVRHNLFKSSTDKKNDMASQDKVSVSARLVQSHPKNPFAAEESDEEVDEEGDVEDFEITNRAAV